MARLRIVVTFGSHVNLGSYIMFSKPQRLRKNADIQTIFARGRGFFGRFLNIKYKRNAQNRRFTVIVSTKVSKKSVARNRYKRIIRECIKKHLNSLPAGDYAISVKPPAAKETEAVLLSELLKILMEIK